ncbi:MAG: thermonuclease family protein [Desulfobacteraceae bacterium]
MRSREAGSAIAGILGRHGGKIAAVRLFKGGCFLLPLLFFLFCPLSLHAKIYTWTDQNGVKHYSNIAPPVPEDRLETVKETGLPGEGTVPEDARGFTVLKVYDGDSMKVRGYGLELMVRLVGIDTPECGRGDTPAQPFCGKAADFLKKRAAGRNVRLKTYGTGGYNRQLAEVFVDGENINIALLRAGLAEVYKGKPPQDLKRAGYKRAESYARKKGLGIWSLGDKYISPRQWRKNHKR